MEPLTFVLNGVSLNVEYEEDGKTKTAWAVEIVWDKRDECFCMKGDGPGNYDFAPCNLEEIARILRGLPRRIAERVNELAADQTVVKAAIASVTENVTGATGPECDGGPEFEPRWKQLGHDGPCSDCDGNECTMNCGPVAKGKGGE